MKKLTNLLPKFIYLLFFFSVGCEKEFDINIDNYSITDENFTLENYKDEFIRNNLKVNLESSYSINLGNEEALIFEADLDADQVLTRNGFLDGFKYYILKLTLDNTFFVMQAQTRKDSPTLNPFDSKYKGVSTLFDLSGDVQMFLIARNDQLELIRLDNELHNKSMARVTTCYELTTIIVTTDHYKDWYQWNYTVNAYDFVWTQYLGQTIEYRYESAPCDYNDELYLTQKVAQYASPPSCADGFIRDENNNCTANIVLLQPDTPIVNMTAYLECFDTNSSAEVTIYATQPVPGSDDAYALSLTGAVVGHTFVSIVQGGNTSVFGFYPSTDDTSIGSPPEPSAMGNDQGAVYNVSVTATVSGSLLANIINHSINYNATYDLDNYNCTDFGIEIGNLSGLGLPDCYGDWLGGGGSNPGALGEYLKSMTLPAGATRNTSGGNAPANNKGC